jgi:hypothetical protein
MKLTVSKLQDTDLNHGCSASPNSLHVIFNTETQSGIPRVFRLSLPWLH